jgi:uncharacterized protein YjiS (DUF1127 family)
MESAMTETAVPLPATVSRCEPCPRRLGCALYQSMVALRTRRALDRLPDDLLQDVGVTRGEIPFVADALACGHGDPTRDAFHPLNRSVAATASIPHV